MVGGQSVDLGRLRGSRTYLIRASGGIGAFVPPANATLNPTLTSIERERLCLTSSDLHRLKGQAA